MRYNLYFVTLEKGSKSRGEYLVAGDRFSDVVSARNELFPNWKIQEVLTIVTEEQLTEVLKTAIANGGEVSRGVETECLKRPKGDWIRQCFEGAVEDNVIRVAS